MTAEEHINELRKEFAEATGLKKTWLTMRESLRLSWFLMEWISSYIIPIAGVIYLFCIALGTMKNGETWLGLFLFLIVCSFVTGTFAMLVREKEE